MHTRLSATFKGVEHGMAVIVLVDGQELKVAKEELQPLPVVGADLTLVLTLAEDAQLDQNALAKHLLNHLLGNEG